jgi:lysozyme family protein
MNDFDQIFAFVVSSEGGFTSNPADPGNWTGRKIGAGKCRGTKFGISAGAHPELDIANLTLDEAKTIYRNEYWNRIGGDRLPAPIALLVFDAAVNNGIGRAVRWLQQAVSVAQDGMIGPRTLESVGRIVARQGGSATLSAELLAQRITFMTSLPTWRSFGLGWARRLFRLPYASLGVHLER